MTTLTNAIRRVPKATYVPLKPAAPLPDIGRAVQKFGYVRQLNLQVGEVDAVQKGLNVLGGARLPGSIAADSNLWPLLKQFEGTPLPARLPAPGTFANIPQTQLDAFGGGLVAIRTQSVQALQAKPQAGEVRADAMIKANSAAALNQLNTAIVAGNVFTANVSAEPIGMLNLERLEMMPAGIERGELLATIPLAPKERTAVVQKEWSVTAQEFTSVVTDLLDTYSETGVTENNELAQSTNSQNSHNNQFNINASVSGSYGMVTASVATQFSTQDQNSQSASDSRKHAVQTTRQASSRVKQSHKVTISTTSVTGSSESSTRILENPSATDPICIDYFSLMRKWHVGLYRYGLRLTYDIAVPEPGAAMRAAFMQLAQLQLQAAQGFTFPVAYSAITEATYQALASQYGAQVPPPPTDTIVQIVGGPLPNLPGDGNLHWVFGQIPFTVPDGYNVTDVKLEVMLSNKDQIRPFYVFGSGQKEDLNGGQVINTYDLTVFNGYMAGAQGSQTITYYVTNCGGGSAIFTITQAPTAQTAEQWVASVWSALYNAAQTSYYANQQAISASITKLQDQINSVDTLTLRREENDEIMKSVLQWLLGPGFRLHAPGCCRPLSIAGQFRASIWRRFHGQ